MSLGRVWGDSRSLGQQTGCLITQRWLKIVSLQPLAKPEPGFSRTQTPHADHSATTFQFCPSLVQDAAETYSGNNLPSHWWVDLDDQLTHYIDHGKRLQNEVVDWRNDMVRLSTLNYSAPFKIVRTCISERWYWKVSPWNVIITSIALVQKTFWNSRLTINW